MQERQRFEGFCMKIHFFDISDDVAQEGFHTFFLDRRPKIVSF